MLTNTFTKSLLAGALLLTGPATFGRPTGTPDQFTVSAYLIKAASKIRLFVEKQPNVFAFVQLLSAAGEELYRAQLPRKGAKFTQVFDLSELENGDYFLRVQQGKDSIVTSVHAQTTSLEPTTSVLLLTLGN